MEVEKYQLALKDLGYFNASPTGYYGQLTTTAVYNFQYDHHLVGSWENDGAGMIGPKTRQKIEEIKQHKYLTWESKPLSTL
jgi:peptidoglycan hydrolase-like protein with peptidoglycan-binding domain